MIIGIAPKTNPYRVANYETSARSVLDVVKLDKYSAKVM